ncbi:MAG: hypothetical protein J7M19_02715 [Planctomycetes bacterium]|nr:hypothetical protein [Planctomycetota bacterium]
MGKYASQKAYGDAEGPFGFPMKSAVAKEVERIWKGLPRECREMGFTRVAAAAASLEIKDGERADVSLVTTDCVDRDSEVMLPAGGDWSQFLKNPIVTFAHRYDELPVGRALWVKRYRDAEVNGWLAKTRYTERPGDWQGQWFPDAVWHFVKSGDLPGKSIGFLPLEVSPPETDELEKRPALTGVHAVIRRWLALEYAVAPVQSNPEALVVVKEMPAAMLSRTGKASLPARVRTDPVTRRVIRQAAAAVDIAKMVSDELDRRRGRV